MKYIILANSSVDFDIPRQLTKINDEELIKRTIRLLKENGVKDILITSHDKRFDNLGATRYEPLYNDWNAKEKTGYWLSAFPIELLNEPICFLMGDVYYSENAIKTIVETPAESTLFFCSYENKDIHYIKHHDEPLGYKVIDYELFKKHIKIVKEKKDKGECCREPIIWELYRSINGQDINTHIMTKNYIAINDESCDIDTKNDIIKLKNVIGGNFMVKLKATRDFSLEEFKKLRNIVRHDITKNNKENDGQLFKDDEFECDEEMAKYLTGKNDKKLIVANILEVIPNEIEQESKKNKKKKNKK